MDTGGSGPRHRDVGIFFGIFALLVLLHAPLLRLPYIWDEAGYYVPAARDLMLSHSLIPLSTVSNAHPPLVMGWLALCWKVFGLEPWVTRSAMLVIASFMLLGVFRLARRAANLQVAVAATLCTGLYSVCFMQSSLAHLDMAAAGFTLWGVHAYVDDRRWASLLWFSLAGLAKETAVLAALALAAWEVLGIVLGRRFSRARLFPPAWSRLVWLVLSLVPLAGWLLYHYSRTGYVFGNPEFYRYNVQATLHPVRILLAAMMRVWQMVGYLHLWVLSLAAALGMFRPPLRDQTGVRPRIAIPIQLVFGVLIVVYVTAMSVLGGAVLARYLLPVLPLGIILCVSTIWRRVETWKPVLAIVVLGFVAAWFVNPPYGFSFEDNLAYRDYIVLHRNAEDFLAARFPHARVLTAWPASDELTRPYLGYVKHPLNVVRIENFSLQELVPAADLRSRYDVVLAFSTKYLPAHSLLERWPQWERLQERFFGFHRDLPVPAVAEVLGGEVVFLQSQNGQWVGVVEVERVVEARARERHDCQ
ncbi:MAG TPA: glycosyltransferase [Terriglobales bacterium]|jgi:hypothetical protein